MTTLIAALIAALIASLIAAQFLWAQVRPRRWRLARLRGDDRRVRHRPSGDARHHRALGWRRRRRRRRRRRQRQRPRRRRRRQRTRRTRRRTRRRGRWRPGRKLLQVRPAGPLVECVPARTVKCRDRAESLGAEAMAKAASFLPHRDFVRPRGTRPERRGAGFSLSCTSRPVQLNG